MPSSADTHPAPFLPPQNLEAEMSLIGSVLLMPSAIDEVWWLKPEQFYADRHEKIWAALLAMHEARKAIDGVTLAEELERRKQLAEVGDMEYLGKFLETVPNAAHAKFYAEAIKRTWLDRTAVRGCQEVVRLVSESHETGDVATKAEQVLSDIVDRAIPRQTIVDMKTLLFDVMADISDRVTNGRQVGTPTGFDDVDAVLGGLVPGELVVVAARPSMGKTSFACCVALNLAEAGKSVLVFSLEASRMELGTRLLCIGSGVDAEVVSSGMKSLTPSDREIEQDKLMQGASRIQELKLHLDETPNQTLRAIIGLCRRHKRRHGLDCVVIDYIQLIEPEDKRIPREQQVATISRRLKGLAKELEIPVIVLAQINRAVETRTVKKPQLSDLRESGAIEQDADKVLFLYREDYYSPGNKPGIAEVIVAKNRNGKTHPGIELGWIESRTTFVSRNQMALSNLAATNRLGPRTF